MGALRQKPGKNRDVPVAHATFAGRLWTHAGTGDASDPLGSLLARPAVGLDDQAAGGKLEQICTVCVAHAFDNAVTRSFGVMTSNRSNALGHMCTVQRSTDPNQRFLEPNEDCTLGRQSKRSFPLSDAKPYVCMGLCVCVCLYVCMLNVSAYVYLFVCAVVMGRDRR
ncbi:unnamed protein product [Protopolystoma xenopodis]|uniref:Uncharacterized protein n=1 Tax=Protopolystoma xenopodis TaxID=117903 RepID=A0A448WJ41_9PLAT|nr:unnamed protein product [Protopolystoma xenopodis]